MKLGVVHVAWVVLTICFSTSIAIVAILQVFAIRINGQNNQFIRLFPPHILKDSRILSLKDDEYYITGIGPESIYLASYLNPNIVLAINKNLKDTITYSLDTRSFDNTDPSFRHLTVNFPYLYINNFVTGTILKKDLSSAGSKIILVDTPRVSTTMFVPYSGSSFAIRSYDNHLKKNVLGRISLSSKHYIFYPGLLEAQIDGIFSTDGILNYNDSTASFVYTYFYRNEFICFDSLFQLRYKAHTLDTNTYAKIKVRVLKDENASTMASPGFYSNRQSCINNQWIIINSDLKADNEDEKMFKKYSVIDMYTLKDGNYHFSFYLPKEDGKISSMTITNNILYTIQGKNLCYFSLNMGLIKI